MELEEESPPPPYSLLEIPSTPFVFPSTLPGFKGSANYVWCTTSVLGKGATGAVFQGVNKHNGETVAVKTFNQLSHMRPQEVQMREFEVLQKVKHENIVKLLAIEEEQEGRGKVIVMELCTGGSLFNLLDDPENNFGLDEDEWLLVLSHLSAGMNHLRDNNLVHRDLKPGNIMKFIKDDGSIVYKLTDFGAARELQDDQQFMSLYGTEEYLHPDMYERAVLRKPVGKTFGATVDLWSIGVTLYHVATGNLPFRPFGGRRNKETMYYITTKKASGVISGVQTSDNGPIQWSRELPNTCLLSQGIKKHITPLLGGLLEVNPQKMWTFDKFFSEVTKILSKKKLHIFFVNKLKELRVYLDKDEKVENLQLLLSEQTEVDPAQQILLYDKTFLSHHVDNTTPGTSYPHTSFMEPIVMFSKENNNIALGIDKDVPAFPSFPNLVSVENDATLAKNACAVGYAYQRKIECYSRCSKIISQIAVKTLSEVISNQLEKLQETCDRCKSMTKAMDNQVSYFQSSHAFHLKTLDLLTHPDESTSIDASTWIKKLSDHCQEEASCLEGVQKKISELAPAIGQLNKRFVHDRQLHREWQDLTRDLANIDTSAIKARTYVAKMKESWQHLLRDRASRTLTYNDEQFHILEKIKMQETIRILMELLQTGVQPVIHQLTDVLADWYKLAQTTFLQTEILHKDIGMFSDEVENFGVTLKAAQENYNTSLNHAIEGIKEQLDNTKKKNGVESKQVKNGVESKQVKKALKSILSTQDEVWGILRENTRLIEQFGQLAMGTASLDTLEVNSLPK